MRKFIIYITVFLCGAIVMALELVASRILSPYVGSSNMVWTSIIGVILISMSFGYWIGGRLADKNPNFNLLATNILIAAIMISIVPIFETAVIKQLALSNISLSVSAVCSTLITFAIPSAFLAMVSPYSIKLMEANDKNVGSISGKLSAISTLGSIFGTFFTGFVLIQLVGNKIIILMSSALLIILAGLLFIMKVKTKIKVLAISITIVLINISIGNAYFFTDNPDIIVDKDSRYSRIWVRELEDYKVLQVERAVESYLTGDGKFGSYLRYYDLFDHYIPEAKNVLMIGGAAYTYPIHFLDTFENKNIDVVEIDPKMTEIAQEHFGLQNNTRLNIYHEDGRSFINKCQNKYDVILIDAFKGHNIPFELTTEEAYSRMKELLNEKGCIIVNVISSIDGHNSGLIMREFSTVGNVFEGVKVFDVGDGAPDEFRNLMLIGFNHKVSDEDSKKYSEMLAKEVKGFHSELEGFTDDFAPVERYTYY